MYLYLNYTPNHCQIMYMEAETRERSCLQRWRRRIHGDSLARSSPSPPRRFTNLGRRPIRANPLPFSLASSQTLNPHPSAFRTPHLPTLLPSLGTPIRRYPPPSPSFSMDLSDAVIPREILHRGSSVPTGRGSILTSPHLPGPSLCSPALTSRSVPGFSFGPLPGQCL
jgi:hypothetical protein